MAITQYQDAENCPYPEDTEHASEKHTQAEGRIDIICLDLPIPQEKTQ